MILSVITQIATVRSTANHRKYHRIFLVSIYVTRCTGVRVFLIAASNPFYRRLAPPSSHGSPPQPIDISCSTEIYFLFINYLGHYLSQFRNCVEDKTFYWSHFLSFSPSNCLVSHSSYISGKWDPVAGLTIDYNSAFNIPFLCDNWIDIIWFVGNTCGIFYFYPRG